MLSVWFVLNTALMSDGTFAARLAGLLVLWLIPMALVAATLRGSNVPEVARGSTPSHSGSWRSRSSPSRAGTDASDSVRSAGSIPSRPV